MPCSEDHLRALAKRYGIGRLIGRRLVFTPQDIERLLEALPRPGNDEAPREPPPVDPDRATRECLALMAQRKRRGRTK